MSLENIQKRAEYLAKIREYFRKLGVLEVDTPLAYNYGVTDPFIDVFEIATVTGKRYLQSSPEYAMKRLVLQEVVVFIKYAKHFVMSLVGSTIIMNLP